MIATAALHNHAMVRKSGAARVLDHHDADVVEHVVEALHGRTMVGAFHATGHLADTFEVMRRSDGRRFVTVTLPLQIEPPETVQTAAIAGTSLREDEAGPMIYRDFLPAALASGRYVATPDPKVVGRGLEAFQHAIDARRAGISGYKLVADLS